ncbi:murein transglycosylase [Vibrio ponticus]|uniref:Murein transglycosylase n=1 Tax=Vibrio ponticus TaxID=265668 RepID=A0A3N3DZ69_9VIBR|nr:transglycosylase SLT domain-containing protein [Vibrio ponticus]ROV59795.1 murein transglycosylase [Vibrio ponticus]
MVRTKISLLTALIVLAFPSTSCANAFDELQTAVKKANQPQQEKIAEFHHWLDQYFTQYEAWRDNYTANQDKQRAALIDKWGSSEISSATKSVEYTEDVKKVIDYENNTATISVLVDANQQDVELNTKQNIEIDGQTISFAKAQKQEVAVDYSLEQENKEKQFIFDQIEDQMRQLDVQADRLIAMNTGAPDDFIYQRAHNKKMELIQSASKRVSAISEQFSAQRAKLGIKLEQPASKEVEAEKSTTVAAPVHESKPPVEVADQEVPPKKAEKKIVSYQVKLPNNSLASLAETYRPLAVKEGERWGIDSSLIMAIMHNESSFRPTVVSGAPAYGLMQVVPTSAGHDVNLQFRGIDAPMSPDDLFVPEINVETGTAYLSILQDRYLNKIKDKQSRTYCMIAAYNTGAGNVGRAFNPDGAINLNNAIDIINTMTPNEVYQHLLEHLPYHETRNYLPKVTQSLALY